MVDRADPLSPPGDGGFVSSRSGLILAIVAGLEVAWLAWFLLVPLPNAKIPNVVMRRGLCSCQTFPEVVPDTSFRESLLGRGLTELSHVENLPQRLPIVLAAALIARRGDRPRRHHHRDPRHSRPPSMVRVACPGVRPGRGPAGQLDPHRRPAGVAGAAVHPDGTCGPLRLRSRVPGSATPRRQPGPGQLEPGHGRGLRSARSRPASLALPPADRPFVVIILLGSMLPATDFDVLEYHLQGPKEYYQAGRIHFLPHNVYTNMPFDVEMLHLLGMAVMGDWWWGALAGQLLVALFGPATAVLIHATAARISPRAGWIAALVYLSTPWVYRFGVIAYVEGPLCFYHAALVWAWLSRPTAPANRLARSWVLLGLLAGGAMGCKYTGFVSAVVPFGVLAVADGCADAAFAPCSRYGLGGAHHGALARQEHRGHRRPGLSPGLPGLPRAAVGRGPGGAMAGASTAPGPSPGKNWPARSSTSRDDRTGSRRSTSPSPRWPCCGAGSRRLAWTSGLTWSTCSSPGGCSPIAWTDSGCRSCRSRR